jgi:predicted nucleic acid-binding protein
MTQATASAAALRLLEASVDERVEIRLPGLWRYEAGNVLARKVPRLAAEAMRSLLAYQLTERALELDYCLDVLRFMRGLPTVSFYDAAYHVLAIRLRGVFITADQQYLARARRRGRIVALSDWTVPSPA